MVQKQSFFTVVEARMSLAPQPQSTFDYIKRRIAKATGLKTYDFRLETEHGQKFTFDAVVLSEFDRLLRDSRLQSPGLLYNKPVVNMCIVVNAK